MKTTFIHLNKNWNAEPNTPAEKIDTKENVLILNFKVNPWTYQGFNNNDTAELRFYGVSRYRLGDTNDEGWYAGQCRFSKLAPKWGEFYEVEGDLLLEKGPADWKDLNFGKGQKHFLFYLKDSTFECDADSFEFIGNR
jgi:hypothetical protein